jgi:hypothetical protein
LGQNSVTVTATRPAAVQPDLAVFGVDILSGTDASLDDVLNAVQGSLLTAANFSGVRSVQQYIANAQPIASLDWNFLVTAPLTNFKPVTTQLAALGQLLAQKKNGMSLSFSVQGAQVSGQAQQGVTCSAADLLTDAKAQAQKMATAAGAGLGGVLAMTGTTVTQAGVSNPFSSPVSVPSCLMTVKFALTGF